MNLEAQLFVDFWLETRLDCADALAIVDDGPVCKQKERLLGTRLIGDIGAQVVYGFIALHVKTL
jgi:hypothetical protein